MTKSLLLLLITLVLLAVFAWLVARIYGKRRRQETERPKYRMLEDD
jgi:cbb3-type cytochrome oxidase subunit 3